MKSALFLARSLKGYTEAAWEAASAPGAKQSFPSLMKRFPTWLRSLGSSPLAMGVPWMPYGAIDFLECVATRDAAVFEWGVGGSTVFFAHRVKELVSVEHDEEWAKSTAEAMTAHANFHWKLLVCPPAPRGPSSDADPADPDSYASAAPAYRGLSFEGYAAAIDRFPDDYFKIVIVDGRCRPSCAMHGMPKVKPGGYLLVDDADRPRYARVWEEMRRTGWTATRWFGPGPCLPQFQVTAAWRRPTAQEPRPC